MAPYHNCAWQDAAGGIYLHARLFVRDPVARERFEIAIGHLVVMCRAEFAAERAFNRLREAQPGNNLTVALAANADAHALLVSAHLAWRTLAELGRRIGRGSPSYKEVHAAQRRHRDVRHRCRLGRDHFEHVTDHLQLGRAVHHGGKMTAKTFRQAMGALAGTAITFGDETFDLAEQIAALADVRRTVAPVLAAFTAPSGRMVVAPRTTPVT